MPVKLSESIIINAQAEIIFDLTQDYTKRLLWDTFLKKAELLGRNEACVGAKAWCVSKHGLGMETEYVSFNRPKVTAVKQTKASMLFKKFSGSWVYHSDSLNATRVTFTYSYLFNFPFEIVQSIIHKVLVRNVQQRLVDLKAMVENGRLN